MNTNESRAAVSIIIWLSMGIAVTAIALSDADTWLAVAAILGGVFSTIVIWNSGEQGMEQDKAKRDSTADTRVQLLMQLMDEEDRAQLKRRLLNELQSDGEIMTVEDLVNSKNGR